MCSTTSSESFLFTSTCTEPKAENQIIVVLISRLFMDRKLLKSKIHRARVTEAELQYEGSITLDGSLMEGAGISEYEHVHIWDLTNGARIETYAICGEPGSGTVCINGAAAHHVKKGDEILIASYGYFSGDEARSFRPKIIFVDEMNRIKK